MAGKKKSAKKATLKAVGNTPKEPTLSEKDLYLRKGRQIARLERKRETLVEKINKYNERFQAELIKANQGLVEKRDVLVKEVNGLQEEIDANAKKWQEAYNKATADMQKEIGEVIQDLGKARQSREDLAEKIIDPDSDSGTVKEPEAESKDELDGSSGDLTPEDLIAELEAGDQT